MLTNFIFETNPGLLSGRISVKKIRKLISNSLFITVLILNLLISASDSYSQSTDDILVLDTLINIAIEKNPQLQSLYIAIQADSAKIPQTGALPDPIPADKFICL